MHVFFLEHKLCELADKESRMLSNVMEALIREGEILRVKLPELADVILIQEKVCYKDFRYINKLLSDPIISRYADKVFTINGDDCATGLLRGLYTSLPKVRFDPRIHRCVPFMDYPNELIFSRRFQQTEPAYLASWRGNPKSNAFRPKMISMLNQNAAFCVEATDSWLNHSAREKEAYVDLILNAKFSLCPAGWAPASFRIYESMALGRCPVILADQFVPPPGPPWKHFALFYPPKNIDGLEKFLKAHENRYAQLGAAAFQAWKEFFGPTTVNKYFAKSLLALVTSTPPTSRDLEVKRWRSLNLFWSNNWTLPQRVLNRARKWSNRLVPNQ